MGRGALLAVVTLLVLPPHASPAAAEGSEALERMARTLMSGVTGPVRALRSGITIETGAGPESVRMEQDLSFELPDKMRNAVRTPLGRQVIVVNGDRGAGLAAGRSQPAVAERVEYGRQSLGRQLQLLAGNAGDPELHAIDNGTESIDGTECDVVSVTFLGAESTLWIDGEGKVLRQRFEGRHFFEGRPGVVDVSFSDYKNMGGYLVPRKQVVSFEGKTLATLTINALDVNPDLSPGLFEIPE